MNKGYIITLNMWGIDLHMLPEKDCRYDVHKAAVYPFRSVAEDVAKYMPRMPDWPAYEVREIKLKD